MRSVVILLAVACGGEGTQLARAPAMSPGELLFNGYTKPDVKCFSCHDGTGAGTKWGPALGDRVPRLDDAQLRSVILDGHDKMPAFRAKLTTGDVAELVTWLRERFGAR